MQTPVAPVTTSMFPDEAGQNTAIVKQNMMIAVITTICRSRPFGIHLSGIQLSIVCLAGNSSIGKEKAK